MKIRVSTIPHSGMKIDAPIPLEPLTARMNEGSRKPDVVFTEAPNADLTLSKTFGGAEIKGVVSAQCTRLCSTCAEHVPHEIVADVCWMIQNLDEVQIEGEGILDDPGLLTYRGDHIDLEDPLQEALILTITPFWHPERDEKQCCLTCKRDCRKSSWGTEDEKPTKRTLGSLLESAATKKR